MKYRKVASDSYTIHATGKHLLAHLETWEGSSAIQRHYRWHVTAELPSGKIFCFGSGEHLVKKGAEDDLHQFLAFARELMGLKETQSPPAEREESDPSYQPKTKEA